VVNCRGAKEKAATFAIGSTEARGYWGRSSSTAPRQRCKAFFLEHFAHRGWTEGLFLFLQSVTDFIHGVILLAQTDDQVAGGRLFWLCRGAMMGCNKKDGIGVAAKVMAKDLKGTDGVAEGPGDLLRRPPLYKEGAQCLVNTVLGGSWLQEEAATSA
jgi:hypothetical protein